MRAVVLGGSIAGLLAAQALADQGDEVIVVERDKLPAGPQGRPGVPQAAHVHGLVSRGQQEIERLLPGFADLVVDATGRGSPADHWLRELEYPAAPEAVADARLGYASRCFQIPAGHRADWKACYIQPGAPHRPRGAMLMPIEGERWLVTLIGIGADRPGRDADGFLPFARSLASPVIADATPISPVQVSGSTSSRRRYVERAAAQPANFVRVGDAICSFNPVYAQGMSTAAAAATLLGHYRAIAGNSANLATRFHRALARVNDWAWLLATTPDLRWPGIRGPHPTPFHRAVGRYIDHVMSSATHDQKTQQALREVLHLLRSPASLIAPHPDPHHPVPVALPRVRRP
ncbi:hypothetical protein V7793_10435 [Streptomyces sp. KLMMK]|uniref:hypothetical protein n=1 Tax=Streptomyces sp. KLMMK TaxID=3109353 RepID=UPI003008D3DE